MWHFIIGFGGGFAIGLLVLCWAMMSCSEQEFTKLINDLYDARHKGGYR